MERTQITRLCKEVRDHPIELAHTVTHYARPGLHITYVHAYHTILSTHNHKVARTMFSRATSY